MRYDVSKCHETPSAMILPDGVTLLATVCNTLPNARPYALWLARKDEQYLVDLSDTLDQPGDIGLTGLTSIGDKLYAAVQSGYGPTHQAPLRIRCHDSREFRVA